MAEVLARSVKHNNLTGAHEPDNRGRNNTPAGVSSKEYRECRNVIDCFLTSNNIADKGARRDRNSLIGQYIWSGKQLLSSSISLDEFRVKSSLFYQSRRVVGEYAIIAIK